MAPFCVVAKAPQPLAHLTASKIVAWLCQSCATDNR
ncbi:Uncharacterised protein [Vibrio cholerae]|nr:Uncharacterised protein [Vibrio cholerae]CSA74172.1 Uncharacterised protein [Vibrio cholerae]